MTKKNNNSEFEIDGPTFFSTLLHWRSEQIRLSSRAWISLALVSIYVIGAIVGKSSGELKLPFIDIKFPKDYFILIMTGFIAAFSSRWLEIENRQLTLYKKVIKKFYLDSKYIKINDTIYKPKDLVDSFTITNTSAVWSSPAQLLDSRFGLLRHCSLPLLVILKLVSIMIHFGLPIAALWLIFNASSEMLSWLKWSIYLLIFISTIQLGIGLINNFEYLVGTIKTLCRKLNYIKGEEN